MNEVVECVGSNVFQAMGKFHRVHDFAQRIPGGPCCFISVAIVVHSARLLKDFLVEVKHLVGLVVAPEEASTASYLV